MNNIDDLIKIILKASFKVHNTLGARFLEKIYEKALHIELQNYDLDVELQYPIKVYYDEEKIGDYYADMFINDCLIVEIKAVEKLNVAHEKQIVNYLVATNIDDGLLLNFGSSSVEYKRKFRVYRKFC